MPSPSSSAMLSLPTCPATLIASISTMNALISAQEIRGRRAPERARRGAPVADARSAPAAHHYPSTVARYSRRRLRDLPLRDRVFIALLVASTLVLGATMVLPDVSVWLYVAFGGLALGAAAVGVTLRWN